MGVTGTTPSTIGRLIEILGRDLCRNPPIPAGVGWSRVLSLAITRAAGNSEQTRMNSAFPCYSDFFGVTPSWAGRRTYKQEVAGSSPALAYQIFSNLHLDRFSYSTQTQQK